MNCTYLHNLIVGVGECVCVRARWAIVVTCYRCVHIYVVIVQHKRTQMNVVMLKHSFKMPPLNAAKNQ